jgi:uncharacterized protein
MEQPAFESPAPRLAAQPDVERACAYALERLGRELPSALCYHSLAHTRDDVAPAVERLAAAEGLDGEAMLLLRTAACYHDIGFVVQRQDHEVIGVGIAAEVLPRFGYAAAQLEIVRGMIMATRLPQSPQTLAEQILADADLDVLGREDFLATNQLLRVEQAQAGMPASDAEWYRVQLRFLRGHRYWTASARALRDAQKQRNIAAMERLLLDCQESS